MNTPSVAVERRIGQRFAFDLPVSVRHVETSTEGLGFTQDLSSRGVFFFTDMALREDTEIELTLKMPSEVTLGETMHVRCRGRVLRTVRAADSGPAEAKSGPPKIGVAVCFSEYEYLPAAEDGPADFRRVSALHNPGESERVAAPGSGIPPAAIH